MISTIFITWLINFSRLAMHNNVMGHFKETCFGVLVKAHMNYNVVQGMIVIWVKFSEYLLLKLL